MAAHRQRPILNFGNTRKARDYRRELVDPLNHYSEEELRSRYRSGREGINFNVELLSDEIAPSTRSHSLSAKEQVSVTLRFLASGSFLEVIGDTFWSYDKSTVSRLVRRVTLALASKVNDFVKFPTTPNERHEIKRGLFRVGGFSRAFISNLKFNLIYFKPKSIYFKPKIHKANNPGRPIVSACSCPTELISSYLDKVMAPIVKSLPSYIAKL